MFIASLILYSHFNVAGCKEWNCDLRLTKRAMKLLRNENFRSSLRTTKVMHGKSMALNSQHWRPFRKFDAWIQCPSGTYGVRIYLMLSLHSSSEFLPGHTKMYRSHRWDDERTTLLLFMFMLYDSRVKFFASNQISTHIQIYTEIFDSKIPFWHWLIF